MERGAATIGLTALAASIALAGCAQGSAGSRVAALRDFARSLPACASGEPAMSVADAMARTWKAGDRLVVRGHLSVVSFGPPCDSNTPPDTDSHCGVAWTLWSSAQHPTAFENSVPGGVVSLATDASVTGGASGLPALVEGSDAKAAQNAVTDLDVTVSGTLPDHLCRHEARPDRPDGEIAIGRKCPRNDYEDCREDCVGTLAEHPLVVATSCRNVGIVTSVR
jgi:hypothetical protein